MAYDDEVDGEEWLMIENPGTVGIELLTVVGASTNRKYAETIGQFGSGAMHGITLLMRNDIPVRFYSGKNGYTFETSSTTTEDVLGYGHAVNEVVMRQIAGGKKVKPLGFDRDFGSMDWRDVGFAVREFVSNAVDACTVLGLYKDGEKPQIKTRWTDKPSGEEGVTRAFIKATPEIREYCKNFRKNFLVFDPDWDPSVGVIPKRVPGSNVRIYRKGVLVGEFGWKSLFDYNLNDIAINESRTVLESEARAACSTALANSSVEVLREWMLALSEGKSLFETSALDAYNIHPGYQDNSDSAKANWSEAFASAFGEKGVVVDSDFASTSVERKGFVPVRIPASLRSAFKGGGVKVSEDVLDHFASKNREEVPLTSEQKAEVAAVWDMLVSLGVTKGKACPAVEGYHNVMEGGSDTDGYYDRVRRVVGVSKETLDASVFELGKVLIEEFGHYITGANDESRDFQDWAFRVAGQLYARSRNAVKGK